MIKKIESEMVLAAKTRDKVRLAALRLIKSALHNKKIDVGKDLNEQESLQVLSSMVKQRKDSIEQFAKGGRQDLVEKEEKELEIIQSFMPQQLSGEELDAIISHAIEEVGATSPRDMGKVMKALMAKVTGKADGKVVSERVKAILSS
ncbi:MAG: GatB/YqeY domain-containing protein [Deltaproteobacteria bacterium]|nr:GatB/YqeY domain-containing protein [Deltaproteobacteria bacterium]